MKLALDLLVIVAISIWLILPVAPSAGVVARHGDETLATSTTAHVIDDHRPSNPLSKAVQDRISARRLKTKESGRGKRKSDLDFPYTTSHRVVGNKKQYGKVVAASEGDGGSAMPAFKRSSSHKSNTSRSRTSRGGSALSDGSIEASTDEIRRYETIKERMSTLTDSDHRKGIRTTSLTKSIFSDRVRLLFVAGLEGSGHHAMADMFQVCMNSSYDQPVPSKATPQRFRCDKADNISRALMHNLDKTGLLFSHDAKNTATHLTRIEDEMRHIVASSLSSSSSHLHLIGLGFTPLVGMLSYPNLNGMDKSLNHPDAFALSAIAESVGLDFRVVVLQRSAAAILRSTERRAFGGIEEPRILIDNAAALYTQLKLLDRRFYHCVQYERLHLMANDTTEQDKVIQFIHPNALRPIFGEMLQKFRSLSSLSSVTSGPARPDRLERPDYGVPRQMNETRSRNSVYYEFQLGVRLQLIDDLCNS
jgi:hypothetical protein